LKDLAGIDAIPSFIDGNKINMSKVRKMATAIHACKKNAEIAYPLEPLQFVDQFLLFKLQVRTLSNTPTHSLCNTLLLT